MNNIQNYGMTNYQANFKGSNPKNVKKTIGMAEEEVIKLMSLRANPNLKSDVKSISDDYIIARIKADTTATKELNKDISKLTEEYEAGRISAQEFSGRLLSIIG